jgi:hypothetical protein
MTRRVEALTVSECLNSSRSITSDGWPSSRRWALPLIIPSTSCVTKTRWCFERRWQQACREQSPALPYLRGRWHRPRSPARLERCRPWTHRGSDRFPQLARLRDIPLWRGTRARTPLLTHQIEPGDRHAHHDCRPAAKLAGIIRSLITDRQPRSRCCRP